MERLEKQSIGQDLCYRFVLGSGSVRNIQSFVTHWTTLCTSVTLYKSFLVLLLATTSSTFSWFFFSLNSLL